MAEEGKNQPPKRNRFKEDDGDRISKLPDCLLAEILSSLPETKHAIRTGSLSKRWEHVWHSVSNLSFMHPYLVNHRDTCPDFFSFVDKTLIQRPCLKLNKFKLHSRYDHRFESQVNSWIHYAISCNVENLSLTLLHGESKPGFPLDQVILSCSGFTDLTLSGCVYNPTEAISWKNLRSLYITCRNLDEVLIEKILSGSPVLETLVLVNCYGYRRLDITSKSVKKLVLCGYMPPDDGCDDLEDVIEINAPNVLSLKIQDNLLLWYLLLLDVSCLVEADLDYSHGGYYETTPEEAKEEMLKRFIHDLRHVKELKIWVFCFEVLSRLEAKGFIFPSNLKVLDVTSSPLYYDNDSVEFDDQEV
ncbi:F-box/LRR-repeat protein 25-like [Bidens hawaiensis]|uniref:F-box/LRR-repeat protein 25-like n=1 Tax=Bidens hawaiensis TaxID=980011 RepID=UPI00404A0A37